MNYQTQNSNKHFKCAKREHRQLKKIRKTVDEQNKNINQQGDRNYSKIKKKEILELKNTITELTNSIGGFSGRLNQAERRTSN